jgi:hypothetical protein
MNQVIQSATSAVASLPALIIQRADPALYNLLIPSCGQTSVIRQKMTEILTHQT